jgi:hypothetical protein
MSKLISSCVFTLCTLSLISGARFDKFTLWHESDLTEACPKYKCKPNSMHFDIETCIFTQESTTYVHACSTGLYCNASQRSGNSTCTLPKPEVGIAYPGENCYSDASCKIGYCMGNICRGKHWLQECAKNEECNVGLFCRKSVCWPLLKEGETCRHDDDCQNHLGCFKSSSQSTGECMEYFSLSTGSRVFDCQKYTSKFCKTLSCMSPGGDGKGLCIDAPQSSKHLLDTCKYNSDCYGETDKYEFYGRCRCGLNSNGQKYCVPFLGDESGKALVKIVKEWYQSKTIHNCHSTRREAQLCIRRWEKYREFIEAYYHFLHRAMYRDADSCIHRVFTSDFWDMN